MVQKLNGSDCCPTCESTLIPLPKPRCHICGGQHDSALKLCSKCLKNPLPPWQYAVSVYPFKGSIRELIHRYKYQGHTYLAPLLAHKMVLDWQQSSDDKVDIVCPIPLHWLKKMMRGYNQAELLSGLIASELAIPNINILKRGQWTKQQAHLGRKERLKNIQKAFVMKKNQSISGKHILLVDDIFTTGATLSAATKVLVANDAAVTVLTIARG